MKIFYKLEVVPAYAGAKALTRAIRNGYLDVVMFLAAIGVTGEVDRRRHPQITEFLADFRGTSPHNTVIESLLTSVTNSASSRLIAKYY